MVSSTLGAADLAGRARTGDESGDGSGDVGGGGEELWSSSPSSMSVSV